MFFIIPFLASCSCRSRIRIPIFLFLMHVSTSFTDDCHAGLPEALLSPTKHPHLALEITTTIFPYTMQINQPISASHLSFPLSIRDRLTSTHADLSICLSSDFTSIHGILYTLFFSFLPTNDSDLECYFSHSRPPFYVSYVYFFTLFTFHTISSFSSLYSGRYFFFPI